VVGIFGGCVVVFVWTPFFLLFESNQFQGPLHRWPLSLSQTNHLANAVNLLVEILLAAFSFPTVYKPHDVKSMMTTLVIFYF
jgi:hypothetical protein